MQNLRLKLSGKNNSSKLASLQVGHDQTWSSHVAHITRNMQKSIYNRDWQLILLFQESPLSKDASYKGENTEGQQAEPAPPPQIRPSIEDSFWTAAPDLTGTESNGSMLTAIVQTFSNSEARKSLRGRERWDATARGERDRCTQVFSDSVWVKLPENIIIPHVHHK